MANSLREDMVERLYQMGYSLSSENSTTNKDDNQSVALYFVKSGKPDVVVVIGSDS